MTKITKMWNKTGESACRRYRKQISLHADGLLTDRQAAELEAHIAECKGCSRFLEDLRRMRDDLRMMSLIEPDEDFHSDAMVALESGNREKHEKSNIWPSFSKVLTGLSGAAAAMIVFVVGLSAITGGFFTGNTQAVRHSSVSQSSVSQSSVSNEKTINDMVITGDISYEDSLIIPSYDSAAGSESLAADNQTDDLYVNIRGSDYESAQLSNAISRDAEAIMPQMSTIEAAGGIALAAPKADIETESLYIYEEIPAAKAQVIHPDNDDLMSENSYLYLEAKDAADFVARINGMSAVNQGINVSNSNLWDNGEYITADISLTVESGQYGFFVDAVSGIATIASRNESSYSIATEITDAANSLEAKENEYNRLLSYSGKAGDISGLITLYDQVGAVINDMDYWRGRLNSLNNTAANNHVQISVTEKREERKDSLEDRIANGFSGSITAVSSASEAVLITAAGVLVPLLLIAGFIGIVLVPFLIWRRRRRHE